MEYDAPSFVLWDLTLRKLSISASRILENIHPGSDFVGTRSSSGFDPCT